LLTILFTNPNFLILDEPTNDLDLPTLAVLENFLSEYQGCVLIVSHDRYFMDRLVDHLFVFEGDGVVRDFPGNYTQYRLWLKEEEKKKQAEYTPKTVAVPAASTVLPPAEASAKRKLSYKEKREFEQLETEIPLLEKEKKALTEKMSGNISFEELSKITARITALTEELEQKEMRWLELSE
ncbi:MAG TPA: hypothetical protein VHB48_17765, partial [Chitinophagaceae bacterium]|nr:hypothetical protein [Chitinophagaceae bacterium]